MYQSGVPDNKAVSVALGQKAELKKVMKRVMPFVAFVKEKVAGPAGLSALDTSLPWDERAVLEDNQDYIGGTFGNRITSTALPRRVIILC